MASPPPGAPSQVSAPPKPKIINQSSFSDAQIDSILGTAARLLLRQNQGKAAHLLADCGGRIIHYDHDNWNGGYDTFRLSLGVPADVYFDLEDRELLEQQINTALGTAMQTFADALIVHITTELNEDPDWREKVHRHLTGESVTNQGRVRSDNIATLQQDGLLFRSRPEILFYNALKRSGVPFAPLSVVLNGGITSPKRIEPDFLLYRFGLTMVVEIDGDLFHRETPAEGHTRLKFLTDEGVIVERIEASVCNTSEKAAAAVARVLQTLEKHRQAR